MKFIERIDRRDPFAHSIIFNLVSAEEISAINKEWPAVGWRHEDGKGQRKSSTQELPPTAAAVVDRLTNDESRDYFSQLFRIPNLLRDDTRFGGGLHSVGRGGFLNCHVDFNLHPNGLWRRVNLLVYLNENWDRSQGGQLKLYDNDGVCMSATSPLAGISVAFATTRNSWHGHPEPLQCPEGVERRSIAIYFYTKEAPPDDLEPRTTIYKNDIGK